MNNNAGVFNSPHTHKHMCIYYKIFTLFAFSFSPFSYFFSPLFTPCSLLPSFPSSITNFSLFLIFLRLRFSSSLSLVSVLQTSRHIRVWRRQSQSNFARCSKGDPLLVTF